MFPNHEKMQSGSARILELFSSATQIIELGANEVLFEEDDPGDSFLSSWMGASRSRSFGMTVVG
ncbi:hypothetical protein [Sulfitobacter sediminilitoris]|uniref:hypothetical protein n=1 Tax=Sulfitobacter sediminilitoris TaxID=2698830 RepID=UPI003618C8F0